MGALSGRVKWGALKIPFFLIVCIAAVFCNSIPCAGKGKKKGRRVEGTTQAYLHSGKSGHHSVSPPSLQEPQDFRQSLLASRAASRICGAPRAEHMGLTLIFSAETHFTGGKTETPGD